MRMLMLMGSGLLVLPASALAINSEPAGFYTGVGVSQITYNDSANTGNTGVEGEPDWTAVELIGGYKQSPYAGLEARLGAGSSPDLLYGGLYYRTESSNETAKTYLLVGYSGASVKATTGDDFSVSGLSYGAGVGFPVGKRFNFNLEYRMLLNDRNDDISLNAFTASLDYRFPDSDMDFLSFSGDPIENGFYAGLGLAQIDYSVDDSEDEEIDEDIDEDGNEDDDSGPDLSWNAIEFIGGYNHSSWLGGELRLGTTDDAGQGSVKLTLNYASAYYRPSISFDGAQLYGLLGYSSVQSRFKETDEETGEVFKDTDTTSGISFGAGMKLPVSEHLKFGVEYRVLIRDKEEGNTFNLNAFSANVIFHL